MAKVGDMLEIKEYIGDDGSQVSLHYFIVVDEVSNAIDGLNYDFRCVWMTSIKDMKQKAVFEKSDNKVVLSDSDIKSKSFHSKESRINCQTLFYFNSNLTRYKKVGRIVPEKMKVILEKILLLVKKRNIRINTFNLYPKLDDNLQDSNLNSTDGTFKQ